MLETQKPKKKAKQRDDIRKHISSEKTNILPTINSSSNSRVNSSYNEGRLAKEKSIFLKKNQKEATDNIQDKRRNSGSDKLKLIHPRVNMVPRKISESPYVINFTKDDNSIEEKRERLKKFNLPTQNKSNQSNSGSKK